MCAGCAVYGTCAVCTAFGVLTGIGLGVSGTGGDDTVLDGADGSYIGAGGVSSERASDCDMCGGRKASRSCLIDSSSGNDASLSSCCA
jgi:hypothetical protein